MKAQPLPAPQLAASLAFRQPPRHRPAPRPGRARTHHSPTAAAQNTRTAPRAEVGPFRRPRLHPPPTTRTGSRRLSEIRRPTSPPGAARPPATGGGRRAPRTATEPRSVASPATGRQPVGSPPPVRRRASLPGTPGRDSPSRTAPALPVRADEQPPGFPPPTTLRSAPPFSFPPLDSSFPRFAAPVPKRPGVIPPPTMFSPKEGHRRGDADGSISCRQNAAPSGSVGSVGGDPGGPRRRAPRPEQPRRSEPTAAPQDAVTG